MSDSWIEYDVTVPPEHDAGSYANLLMVWHTEHEFTLDFCAPYSEPADPAPRAILVVSRLRVPVTMMFEMIRVMNERMTEYESRWGEIRRSSGEERS